MQRGHGGTDVRLDGPAPDARPASPPLSLVASGVCRHIGGRALLEDIDLTAYAGEVLGLIGPNGGGKSTLLAVLAGLVRPDMGSATLDEVPTHTLALNAAGSIGLVTARPGFYPALTGRENLAWFAALYEASADLGLADRLGIDLDQRVGTLSSGQQQKLSLVRALATSPRVLLFDEPTANLDPLSAATLHQAVRERADAGTIVVLCTHDLHAAEQICDRVAVLNRVLVSTTALEGQRRVPEPGRLHKLFEEAR